jgi:hypothetical protein
MEEVTFKLAPEDLQQFENWHQRNKGCLSAPQLAILFVFLVGSLVMQFAADRRVRLKWALWGPIEFLRREPQLVISILVPLLFVGIFWTFILKMPARMKYRGLLDSPAFREPWRAQLRPDGLYTIQPVAESLYRWPYVEEVAQNETHLFIQVDKNSAVVIPKSAFSDEAHAQRFFQSADSLWREAKDLPPIPEPKS